MKSLLTITLSIFLLSSCNTSKKIEQPQEANFEFCESMTYNTTSVSNIATDYYKVDTVFITNNCINIWVSYSGGCGDADFTLYFTDIIKESVPPKTNLRLQLLDNDPCRSIVQQKLYYNLNFFDSYAINDGIIFQLVGSDMSVLYKK